MERQFTFLTRELAYNFVVMIGGDLFKADNSPKSTHPLQDDESKRWIVKVSCGPVTMRIVDALARGLSQGYSKCEDAMRAALNTDEQGYGLISVAHKANGAEYELSVAREELRKLSERIVDDPSWREPDTA